MGDSEGLSNLLSAFGGKNAGEGPDPAMLLRAGKALSAMQKKPDDRAALLRALKPFLRKGRRERVDEAIRILQMMRLAELFRKEMD